MLLLGMNIAIAGLYKLCGRKLIMLKMGTYIKISTIAVLFALQSVTQGQLTDQQAERIRAAVPTIEFILDKEKRKGMDLFLSLMQRL